MILAIFLISIFTFLFLGVPVAFSILLTVLTMAESSGVTSYEIVPSYLYSGVNNFALLAIPFFVFCGDLMPATFPRVSWNSAGFCWDTSEPVSVMLPSWHA